MANKTNKKTLLQCYHHEINFPIESVMVLFDEIKKAHLLQKYFLKNCLIF